MNPSVLDHCLQFLAIQGVCALNAMQGERWGAGQQPMQGRASRNPGKCPPASSEPCVQPSPAEAAPQAADGAHADGIQGLCMQDPQEVFVLRALNGERLRAGQQPGQDSRAS